MEVYILDDLLRRNAVIDRFESLIWTERYSAFGDFQLVIHSTLRSRGQLVEGTYLTINASRKIMVVENVENKDDSEGRSLLTVTGRSLEAVLIDRIARENLHSMNSSPSWIIADKTPADAIRYMFKRVCVDGALHPSDVIPFYETGSLYPTNTIAEPDTLVTVSIDPKSLYEAIKETADVYGLGFRLYRGPDTSKLYFNVYTGDDRTSSQTTLPAVIFAPDLENLTNTSEFRSIEQYKNAVLVTGNTRTVWVYADDVAVNAAGFDRRSFTLQVSDIEEDKYELTAEQIEVMQIAIDSTSDETLKDILQRYLAGRDTTQPERDTVWANFYTSGPLTTDQKAIFQEVVTAYTTFLTDVVPVVEAALTKKGEDELTKFKALKAMDGELGINSKYRYGVDYELGDLVEMRNEDGLTNRMRVTEQIFVDDSQGERSYPTLAVDQFITPGTWYAWDANGVWDSAIGTWDDQPE